MTTASSDAIAAAVGGLQDEAAALLSDLVRCDSTLGNEGPAIDLLARTFAGLGLEVDRFAIDRGAITGHAGFSPADWSYDGKENVVGVHRPRAGGGRSLIFNGHVDVVPPGPAEMWVTPPFEPAVRDGWLHGRGAGDMKAGIVAFTIAFKALRKLGLQPAAPVFLQAVVEEECTGNGALACLVRGYRADAAIIPEPFEQSLMSAQLGVMWVRVRVSGKPAHVLDTSAGANAIERAFAIYNALRRLEQRWNAQDQRHPAYADHPHPVNFNLGTIHGGDWPSTVPTECVFEVRVGFYPGVALERVRQEVEATIHDATTGAGEPPEITYVGFQAEGCTVDLDHPAFALLAETHERFGHPPAARQAVTCTTDARFFNLYGDTPATCYGPLARSIHGIDEAVSLLSLCEVTCVLALFMSEWCGIEPA